MAQSLHDPRYKRLIELIVQSRLSAGLTQRDVARRLRKTPSYIGKIESRQRRIDVLKLIDLLDSLDVNPAHFTATLIETLKKRRHA